MSTIYIREQGQLVPLNIPEYRGDKGEAGKTPDLQVGSVTTLPSDQQASATIQGDKENPTINFGLPSGATGEKGLYVGRPEDAYDETKVVFDDENWIDDTYFKNSTIDYMGGKHKSLKEKSDSDVEYILRKIGTQHYEGTNVTATNTYAMQVKSAIFKGRTLKNMILDDFPVTTNFKDFALDSTPVSGKTYTFLLDVEIKGAIFSFGVLNTQGTHWAVLLTNLSEGGVLKFEVVMGNNPSNRLRIARNSGNSNIVINNFVMIEGSHHQISKPFSGLLSVKSPMLTVTNADSTQSHTLVAPQDLELRSNGNVYDELDLITGKLTQRIGEDGNVLTQPTIKTIDLNNQKIYSYDGTTHYITSSLQGHPNPILSIDVPTNITSLLKHQQNTINQQRLILSKREEMQNILIESMLYRYEQSTLLNDTIEVVPDYIQKLYEVAYQRGIRFRKEE